mmetsp:Transcript_17706/g.28237  ORF Transcript_17706/g.28237 Transcript_17706/m.28237 type:complete len:376 (-) Transcript_17706:185-1312(-)
MLPRTSNGQVDPSLMSPPPETNNVGEEEMVLASVDSYGRILGVSELGLDFSFKSIDNALQISEKDLSGIKLDCRYVDSPLFPNTFWMPANGKARCSLERLAISIFNLHASKLRTKGSGSDNFIDWENTGIEWWVQHCERTRDSKASERKGIGFHWDKDEEMRCKAGIYVHAALSTVTYLTYPDTPTLVVNKRISSDGKLIGGSIKSGVLSYPRVGKHFAFDARLLHGVPPLLHPKQASRKRKKSSAQSPNGEEGKYEKLEDLEKDVRVTFLANIWISHKPVGVKRLPYSSLKHLSDIQVKLGGSPSKLTVIKVSKSTKKHLFNFGPTGREYELDLALDVERLLNSDADKNISSSIQLDFADENGILRHSKKSVSA